MQQQHHHHSTVVAASSSMSRVHRLAEYLGKLCRIDERGGRILFSTSAKLLNSMHHHHQTNHDPAKALHEGEHDDDDDDAPLTCDTCSLVDVPIWTQDMATCTKSRFADADIQVVQSSASLSGFSVVIRLDAESTRSRRSSSITTRSGIHLAARRTQTGKHADALTHRWRWGFGMSPWKNEPTTQSMFLSSWCGRICDATHHYYVSSHIVGLAMSAFIVYLTLSIVHRLDNTLAFVTHHAEL